MSNSKTKAFIKELYLTAKEECIYFSTLRYFAAILLLGLFTTPSNKLPAISAEQKEDAFEKPQCSTLNF